MALPPDQRRRLQGARPRPASGVTGLPKESALDTVSLRLPASPEYLQVIRLVSTGLAAGLAFTLEDIDDLKIAVDELTAYLTGPQGREGILELAFTVHDDRIEITGRGSLSGVAKVRTELTQFSRMILETVADESSLQQKDGSPTFKIVKRKSS